MKIRPTYFLSEHRRQVLMAKLIKFGMKCEKAVETVHLENSPDLVDTTMSLYVQSIKAKCEELAQTFDVHKLRYIAETMRADTLIVTTFREEAIERYGDSVPLYFPMWVGASIKAVLLQ